MFEKEAEEYRKDLKSKFFLSEPQLDFACQGFKDGYNKCREQLTKAKELIKEMLSILPKENIEGVYEITEEAEQFIRGVKEK